MPDTYAIIPAAGFGLRMGKDRPKQFLELSGRSILALTLDTFLRVPFISGICLVVPKDFMDRARQIALDCCREIVKSLGGCPPVQVVAGGRERQDSVYNGLEQLPQECEWVVIHDGVRPFVSARLIEETWRAAMQCGAAIAALPSTDTVKRVEGKEVAQTLRRDEIWLVQTPQIFRKDLLMSAYSEAKKQGWTGTDDASFVEWLGETVCVVRGERSNIKVTTPEDLEWAQWFLEKKV
jgi:2-C-methyl-D-erythritol 4-phosphate cytidylyltransferase